MKNTKKKGFTIVELVIVIAVIAILSAILIPTFSGLVQRANETKLKADLRNAYMMYAEEHANAESFYDRESIVLKDAKGTYYVYSAEKDEYTKDSEVTLEKVTVTDAEGNETEEVKSYGEYLGYEAYHLVKA